MNQRRRPPGGGLSPADFAAASGGAEAPRGLRPALLNTSFRPKIWGSTALQPWFDTPREKIGEVWFTHQPPLDLLVKFIFTTDRLSVQVHPDDAYAGAHGLGAGKMELWHVLRAGPGAAIAAGLREPLSRERARQAALTGEIERLLQWWPAQAGDTFFIPPGTVHAIGAGLVICEVQQNSDITYRLYDYDRPRELHLEHALEVARLEPHPGKVAPGVGESVACPRFTVDFVECAGDARTLPARPGQILVALEGSGWIDEQPFRAGQAWVAEGDGWEFILRPAGPVRLLRAWTPAPDQPR